MLLLNSWFQGATFNSINMPGIAKIKQKEKNEVQPMLSTIKPDAALAKVRGIAVSALSKANCVAANLRLVCCIIKARKAAVPKPTPKYSKLTTNPKAIKLCSL